MAQRPKNRRPYHPKGWLTIARTCGYDYRKLARRCNITVRTLQRWFRAEHAMTPDQWLIELRLKDAAIMLKKAKSVRSVQEKLGLKYASHFSRDFKRDHRKTPSEVLGVGQLG